MSDDNKNEPEPKEEPKAEVKPLPDLDKITPKHLADLERKIRDEMTELHAKDHEEKEELKRQLAELQEHKEKQEKAEEEKDKTKSSEHTMVLPPSDIPPQQPNPVPTTHEGSDGKKASFWKRAW